MTNKLAERGNKAMLGHVQKSVQGALAEMPDLINQSEATRLTLNIWSQALESASTSKNFQWTDNGMRNFITQAIKYVALGLDAANRELYVFPYGNQMTITPATHGLVKLAKEYAVGDRKVLDILPFAVRQGEAFHVKYGSRTDEWEYQNQMFNNAPPIGYVTVLVYDDGTSRVMEHTLEDIDKRRKASKAPNSPAWTNWPVEMAKTKAVRRHASTIQIKLRPELEKVGIKTIYDLPDADDIKDVTPEVIMLPRQEEPEVETIDPGYDQPLPYDLGNNQGQIDESWMK